MSTSFLYVLKKRVRRIRQQATTLARNSRQEPLHQLRVDLKRLRAQLRLLRAVDPGFPYGEVYAPYKKLFAAAGAVRFWQLQAGILADTPRLPGAFARVYRIYINRRLRNALESFRQTAAGEDLPHWRDLRHEFETSSEQCTPLTLSAYFRTLQEAISEISGHLQRRHAKELHDLRKYLKEYANNRQLTVRHLNFDPGPPPGLPPGSTDFDELLGQWHDLDAACTQLNADLRKEKWEENAVAGGKEILGTWREAERELWKMIHSVLI